jgi:hypothetical protein
LKLHSVFRSRATAVAAGAVVLTMAAGGAAFATGAITSADIANGTVRTVDLATGSVNHRVVKDGSIRRRDLHAGLAKRLSTPGPQGVPGQDGQQGPAGPAGPDGAAATYDGPNWSLVDRNVIGNAMAYLRSGPSAAGGLGDVQPPMGIGSLGIHTGSAADKAVFGNQVDFAGNPLSGLSTVSYYVFATGEDLGVGTANPTPANLAGVSFEVNPGQITGGGSYTYSTLVYVPVDDTTPNGWQKQNASTAKQWFLTGRAGTDSHCNQGADGYCTLAQVESVMPSATILSAQITKGRDSAFTGAVDVLQINGFVYDFEPLGVTKSAVN